MRLARPDDARRGPTRPVRLSPPRTAPVRPVLPGGRPVRLSPPRTAPVRPVLPGAARYRCTAA
ncbi:hypothetical protein [Streptomyces erythrochromogenes]|uniref:hypothetical protein n=1 Tax=Streptomyces erythrochromogenes TaxID=285574 RepID=UPI0037FF0999